jgi:hypothetical protein
MESGTKRIRGRVYPWGIVDIESDVCDFNKLRTFICRFVPRFFYLCSFLNQSWIFNLNLAFLK